MSHDVFEARYHAKRNAGISAKRKDGSYCSAETDKQAGHAELFAANELGGVANTSVTVTGDGGYDFSVDVITSNGSITKMGVEVVWNGFAPGKDRAPRVGGTLIINPFEFEQRYGNSSLFILVGGTIEYGFSFLGWATIKDLTKRPTRDFGYGPRYWVPANELRQINTLKRLIVSSSEKDGDGKAA